LAADAALGSRAIEVAIVVLHQPGFWIEPQWAPNETSVVNTPAGVTRKTVPKPPAPPYVVVP
jgi:hypothetical protein